MSWLVEDAALSFEQGSPLPARSAEPAAGHRAGRGVRRWADGVGCKVRRYNIVTSHIEGGMVGQKSRRNYGFLPPLAGVITADGN